MDIKLTDTQARELVIICRKLSNSELDFINEFADLGVKQFADDLISRIEAEGMKRRQMYLYISEIKHIIDQTLNAK